MGQKMKRRTGKPILVIVAGFIWLAPTGLFGNSWKPVELYPSESCLKIEMKKEQALWLADQHQSSAPDASSNKSEGKSTAKSKPETGSGKTEAETEKKKSIKPFHPSERISADQAVDFPSDI